jgi:hypothetical protein
MQPASELPAFLHRASQFLAMSEEHRQAAAMIGEIADSAVQPFNLAVVGRMKAGKSTLINGLIGRDLAISGVEEATATLNWICHGTREKQDHFDVHWRDGRIEPYPIGDLTLWTGKSPEVLDKVRRTRFLKLYAEAPSLAGVQIVDTPGTGSSVEEHEVVRDFLSPETISRSIEEGGKADAVLYVVGPVGREKDEEILQVFAEGRLANSGPYNSLAILHKWDALETDAPRARAQAKAARFLDQLTDMVADVIAVSGPLSLTARSAPERFFSSLISEIQKDRDDLDEALLSDTLWKTDPERVDVYSQYKALSQGSMPWASFRLLVRLLHRESITDPAKARARCLEESGILDLEKALQDRFFSRQSIIKQCQVLTRAAAILDPALRKIDDRDRGSQSSVPSAVTVDREWQAHRAALEDLGMDLRVAGEQEKRPDLFPRAEGPLILAICNHLAALGGRRDLGTGRAVSLNEVESLIQQYRVRENGARLRDRPLLAHVVNRLEQIHLALQSH